MFALVISIMLVSVLAISTVHAAAPERMPEVLMMFGGIILFGILNGFRTYRIYKKKEKLLIEAKQKSIKMLREHEIKDFIVDLLLKNEIETHHVTEILSILKTGRIKKEKLASDIFMDYKSKAENHYTELSSNFDVNKTN